jgi:acyl-CoA synthetase (AMP-forming)/AMP-acid ligase II
MTTSQSIAPPNDAMKIADFFDQAARRHGARPCLQTDSLMLDYRTVQLRSNAFSRELVRRGLAGARIAIVCPNDPLAVIALLGLSRAGCIWVPIGIGDPVHAIAANVTRTESPLLLFHSRYAAVAAAVRCELPETVCVCIDAQLAGFEFFEAWCSGDDSALVLMPRASDELADVSFTGGSTGVPKCLVATHRVYETMIGTMLLAFRPAPQARFLVVTPFIHAAGAVALAFLAVGACVVFSGGTKSGDVLTAIERHGVTHVFLPPTLIYALLADDSLPQRNLSGLSAIIYGASPIAPEKLRAAIAAFGTEFHQCYGQSEAAMICTHLSPEDHRAAMTPEGAHLLSSAGRPTPLMRVEIMNDAGDLLGKNDVGEIVVRGGLVIPGYLNDPEATSSVQAHGWHHTGDVGFKNADDYLFIVDRKKDMIVSGGVNVYPAPVERVILGNPDVAACAVVGVPDDRWGEAVTAVVEIRPGASIAAVELAELVKQELGSVHAPKTVHFWERLPRTSVGKIDKPAIRAHFWAGRSRSVS